MKLTTKETELLKDLKTQEILCIEKYTKHSACAKDEQLKNYLSKTAENEKTHLSWLDTIGKGEVPNTGTPSGSPTTFTANYNTLSSPDKENDSYICNDLLSSEKHASALYDTCVFEFADEGMRNVLNTIQKQEQHHGKELYDYMKTNNMYS